jgi:signal-transduction protein with cAMP-binding, CBS, and nucleotidyltransferase domain
LNINKHILQFRNYISNEVELSESEIDDLMEFSFIKNFKKDEILIKQFEPCTVVHFILSGSVKYSILDFKKGSNCINFKFENSFATAYSIINNNVSKFDVICLEDSIMLLINVNSILKLAEKSKKFNDFTSELVEIQLLGLIDYVLDSVSKSVIDRYNSLEINFPNINQRVPQYLIANYLGVTKEHLSRLKGSRYLKKSSE